MHYSVIYRSATGTNHLQKEMYRSLDDAEEGVLDSHPWLSEDQWQRGDHTSIFNLNDGSCFIIFPS